MYIIVDHSQVILRTVFLDGLISSNLVGSDRPRLRCWKTPELDRALDRAPGGQNSHILIYWFTIFLTN